MESSIDTFSAMQTEEPLARFRKTILGKVHVLVLDPFTGKVEEVILEGDPRKLPQGSFIELWDKKGEMFFRRANRKHFEKGSLSEMFKVPEEQVSPNQITDEQIDEVLNKPFLALDKKLNEFTSTAPVARFLNRARELDKSVKVVKRIEEALALLERGE